MGARPGRLVVALTTLALAAPSSAQTSGADAVLGPLYQLRLADDRAMARLLRLRRPRVSRSERANEMRRWWQAEVVAVWPAAGARPAQAIVVARLLEEGMGYRNGPNELEARRAAVTVGPRGRVVVSEPSLAATDWRITASPTAPDVDGDGLPEVVVVGPDPGAPGHCGQSGSGDECVACEVRGGTAVTVRGSAGAELLAPTHFSDTVRDTSLDERVRAQLANYGTSDGGDLPPCPAPAPAYQTDRAHSRPFIRRTAEGAELGWSYARSVCHGWGAEPSGDSRGPSCEHGGGWFRTVSLRGPDTSSDVEDRDAGFEPSVRATCAGCTVQAVRWRLADGERAPHRIPVALAPRELGQPAGSTHDGGQTVFLGSDVYAVQVRRNAEVLGVWQVTITPWDREHITLAP